MCPKVSVIIPYHNQPQYVLDTVGSVLNQTYQLFEIIVVDDGSPVALPRSDVWTHPKVHVIRQSQRGLSGARNAGLAAATGDLFVFLDSDDLLPPGALAVHANAISSSEAVISLGVYRHFRVVPGDLETVIAPPLRFAPLPTFIHRNIAPPRAFCVHRRVIALVGTFDEHLSPCADWDLWLRAAISRMPFITVPAHVAEYRKYSGSMSTQLELMLKSRVEVLLKATDILLASRERYEELGPELLAAHVRVFRRLCALNVYPDLQRLLARNIRAFIRQGFSRRTGKGWITRQMLGTLYDRVVVYACAWIKPKYHQSLRSGIA